MKIRYTLATNRLTVHGEPGNYVARVTSTGKMDEEDIVDMMLEQGSTITRADILAVLDRYNGTIERLVTEGYIVSTPLVRLQAHIRGTFESHDENFNRKRHQLTVTARARKRFNQRLTRNARVERHGGRTPTPHPQWFTDANSGTENELLTPGGLAKVWGSNMQIDPADETTGLFFLGEDGSLTRATVFASNTATNLIFQVPDLPPGEYSLLVRDRFGESVRQGALRGTLTVAGDNSE